jgi:hypothetical protein
MRASNLCKGYFLGLILILPITFVVGDITALAFQEDQLAHTFLDVDPAVSAGAVAELQGEITSPSRFCWRQVGDDSTSGIGALTYAQNRDVTGYVQMLQCNTQPVAMSRKDKIIATLRAMSFNGTQVPLRKVLGVNDSTRNVLKYHELLAR